MNIKYALHCGQFIDTTRIIAGGNRGLKGLRKATGREPRFHCENCKCNRYSPCTCQKKNG